MTNRVLAAIPRNGGEELRVSLDEYRGHTFANVRVWFSVGGGEMRPGKQGVTVPLWAIDEVCAALAQAQAIARQEGLAHEASHAQPHH